MKVYLVKHEITIYGEKVDTEYRYAIGERLFVYDKAYHEYAYMRPVTGPKGDEISPNEIIDKSGLLKFIFARERIWL